MRACGWAVLVLPGPEYLTLSIMQVTIAVMQPATEITEEAADVAAVQDALTPRGRPLRGRPFRMNTEGTV